MSWEKADPFRPRTYGYAKDKGYNGTQRKGSLQLGTTGRGIGSLDIYLPEAQYDDIDHTTNRRGEFNKIQQTQTTFPSKPPAGKRRCLIMTIVVSVVVVIAVVVPVVVVWMSGQFEGDQQLEQGAVLKNSGKDINGINATTSPAPSSTSSTTSSSSTALSKQTTTAHSTQTSSTTSTTESTTSPVTSTTTQSTTSRIASTTTQSSNTSPITSSTTQSTTSPIDSTKIQSTTSRIASTTTQSPNTSPISSSTTQSTTTSVTATTTKSTKASVITSPTTQSTTPVTSTTKSTNMSPITSPTMQSTNVSLITLSTTQSKTTSVPSTTTKTPKTSTITSPTTQSTKTSGTSTNKSTTMPPITSSTTQPTTTSGTSTTTKSTKTSLIPLTTTQSTKTSPITSPTKQSTQTTPITTETTIKVTSSNARLVTSNTSAATSTEEMSSTATATPTPSKTSTLARNASSNVAQSSTEITSTTTTPTTTTTTTSPTTTPSPTTMKMFGSETLLNYGSASVICGVANPRNWHHVTLRHVGLNGNERDIYVLERGRTPKRGDGLDPNKISITWYVTPTDIYLLVAFKPATCDDVGSYFCDLISHSANITSVATITVKAMPSQPTLTIPGNLVAGQRTEITCSGNVGFPGGRMLIYIKNEKSSILKEIGPSDGLTMVRKRANCHNYVESIFPLTPVSAGNDTSIICMVENGLIANDMVRQVSRSDVTVLPDGLCVGTSQTVPHPFTCTKFIACLPDGLTVLTCPDETCYDVTASACQNEAMPSSKRADLTMETAIIIKDTKSPIITCRVNDVTAPFNLTILQATDNDVFEHLISVLPNTVMSSARVSSRKITPTVARATSGVSVTLVPRSVTCSDSGLYQCFLEMGSEKISKTAHVKVNAYPTKPSLRLDTDLTVGKSTRAECKGSVGSPGGKIQWYLKPAAMQNFMELNIATDSTEKVDCSNQVVSSFVYTPVLSANGSVLKCVSTNDNYPSVSREETSDNMQLLLLTGDECSGKGTDTKLSHPYTCDKYIHCSGSGQTVHACAHGGCFDPETQTCIDGSP